MDPVSFGATGQETQGQTETSSEATPVEGGNPFLNEVAADHRPIVAPYLKKWDAEVTKKFEEYSNKLKPWQELGEPDEVKQYVQFAKNFRQDPEAYFRAMWSRMAEHFGDDFENQLFRILQVEREGQQMSDGYDQGFEGYDGGGQEFEGQPDQQEVMLQNMMKELTELREWKEGQTQREQFQQESQQFEAFLEQMHTRFGEFDDDWVAQRISIHGDPNKAMQEWNALVEKISGRKNGETPRQPSVVRGEFQIQPLILQRQEGKIERLLSWQNWQN
jgi:hypothetical protein